MQRRLKAPPSLASLQGQAHLFHPTACIPSQGHSQLKTGASATTSVTAVIPARPRLRWASCCDPLRLGVARIGMRMLQDNHKQQLICHAHERRYNDQGMTRKAIHKGLHHLSCHAGMPAQTRCGLSAARSHGQCTMNVSRARRRSMMTCVARQVLLGCTSTSCRTHCSDAAHTQPATISTSNPHQRCR